MTTWIYLHTERSCCAQDRERARCFDRPGLCLRPAHLGGLCAMHFMAARPSERAVALLLDSLDRCDD